MRPQWSGGRPEWGGDTARMGRRYGSNGAAERPEWSGGAAGPGKSPRFGENQSSSSLSTAMKASLGSSTEPMRRIFFLPSFCFSSSFFLRLMSPP